VSQSSLTCRCHDGTSRPDRSTTAAKAEFHQLLQENKRLHRAIQSADNPAVVAAAARKQGMVAEGETPFVMHGLSR